MTRRDVGLDLELHKDYINTLSSFAIGDRDSQFEILENYEVNRPEYKNVVKMKFGAKNKEGLTENEFKQLQTNARAISNSLAKIKRQHYNKVSKEDE